MVDQLTEVSNQEVPLVKSSLSGEFDTSWGQITLKFQHGANIESAPSNADKDKRVARNYFDCIERLEGLNSVQLQDYRDPDDNHIRYWDLRVSNGKDGSYSFNCRLNHDSQGKLLIEDITFCFDELTGDWITKAKELLSTWKQLRTQDWDEETLNQLLDSYKLDIDNWKQGQELEAMERTQKKIEMQEQATKLYQEFSEILQRYHHSNLDFDPTLLGTSGLDDLPQRLSSNGFDYLVHYFYSDSLAAELQSNEFISYLEEYIAHVGIGHNSSLYAHEMQLSGKEIVRQTLPDLMEFLKLDQKYPLLSGTIVSTTHPKFIQEGTGFGSREIKYVLGIDQFAKRSLVSDEDIGSPDSDHGWANSTDEYWNNHLVSVKDAILLQAIEDWKWQQNRRIRPESSGAENMQYYEVMVLGNVNLPLEAQEIIEAKPQPVILPIKHPQEVIAP